MTCPKTKPLALHHIINGIVANSLIHYNIFHNYSKHITIAAYSFITVPSSGQESRYDAVLRHLAATGPPYQKSAQKEISKDKKMSIQAHCKGICES